MYYSKRLADIQNDQLQRALDRFELGELKAVEFITTGHFGQNLMLSTSSGEYVFRGNPIRPEQFPKEQFFARLIAETTSLETPWPYYHDPTTDLFGWEYAVMPRLKGSASEMPESVAAVVPARDHGDVAFSLGVALSELQHTTFPYAGRFEIETGSVVAFDHGYRAWAKSLVQQTFDVALGLSSSDRRWIAGRLEEIEQSVGVEFRPVICHADFHNANVLIQLVGNTWSVTGIIDLTSCHIGHPESDLARQFCLYAETRPDLAKEFLRGYTSRTELSSGWRDRVGVFILHDRLKFWEWAKRKNDAWWDDGLSFRQWFDSFVRHLG